MADRHEDLNQTFDGLLLLKAVHFSWIAMPDLQGRRPQKAAEHNLEKLEDRFMATPGKNRNPGQFTCRVTERKNPLNHQRVFAFWRRGRDSNPR